MHFDKKYLSESF